MLAGGPGADAENPLLRTRSPAAVTLGGTHRLIDVPISNCLNSQLERMSVLTQFNSWSLNQHVAVAYNPGYVSGVGGEGFVDVVAASQTGGHADWTHGSADAVRRFLSTTAGDDGQPIGGLESCGRASGRRVVDAYIILSGEGIYRMDFRDVVRAHFAAGADVTLVTTPVPESRTSMHGIAGVSKCHVDDFCDADECGKDRLGRVLKFVEKPGPDALDALRAGEHATAHTTRGKPFAASTGIYVVTRQALVDVLGPEPEEGGLTNMCDAVPRALELGLKVNAYSFDGFWRSVSRLADFYRTNLDLATGNTPGFSLHDQHWKFYTRARYLPPSRVLGDCRLEKSLIGEGCVIRANSIVQSVVGNGTIIGPGAVIERSVIVGSQDKLYVHDRPHIGAKSVLKGVIVDKSARVGQNCRVTNAEGVQEADRTDEGYVIHDGIIVVLHDKSIADNTVI